MTILKLGFAMGGGVSLGTFNAGALSQSIKLAILYAEDRDGISFESVEIDVFSGASAGSISLALMLRSLAAQTPQQIDKATCDIEDEFTKELVDTLPVGKKKALIAAQVMQNEQHNIWVKKIRMDKLLAPGSGAIDDNDSLKYTAGILNRAALENIAVELIKESPTININKSKELLANRVLFASSLSNLTPIIQNAKNEFSVSAGGEFALGDGMTSYTHRESRVFDLYLGAKDLDDLNDKEKHPNRWVRYHLGDIGEGVIGDMRDDNHDVWWKIVSTAMASGAFPMAFEPVVLERYKYEYADTWPKELNGQEQFNFTYIDGGVFNNEPIRDAFKLASFMDANDVRPNIERAIIFVDPSVTVNKTQLNVPVHSRFKLTSPVFGDNVFGDIDGVDLIVKTSLDRLQRHIGSIVTSIFNQARALEGDKIFQVRKKFKNRNAIRKRYANQSSINASPELLSTLLAHIQQVQESDDEHVLFPNVGLNIIAEVKRITREEPTLFSDVNFNQIENDLNKIKSNLVPSYPADKWYLFFRFIMLDQSMRLTGKSDKTRFFAIGPYTNFVVGGKPKRIELPGDKLQAFGGFLYEPTRDLDMQLGKFCAHQALTTENFLHLAPLTSKEPEFTAAHKKGYEQALRKGTNDLIDRVLDMVSESHVPLISSIPKFALKFLVENILHNEVLPGEIELRIKIPKGKDLELDGRGRIPILGDKDIHPVQLNDEDYLITTAEYKDNKWVGEHVSSDQNIFVDKRNRKYATLPVPNKALLVQLKLHGYAYLVYDFSLEEDHNAWSVEAPLIPMHEVLMARN
jgi:predicted acylesterase/phospholipase RssA